MFRDFGLARVDKGGMMEDLQLSKRQAGASPFGLADVESQSGEEEMRKI